MVCPKKEGEHGVTTAHTQKEFRTDNQRFIIIFASGTRKFIKNMITDTLQVNMVGTMATVDGNSTAAIVKNNHKAVENQGVRQHPKTINLSRVRQVHDCVNKMICNAEGCKQGRYDETSNEVRKRSAALARLTSHISAVVELVRELARTSLQR